MRATNNFHKSPWYSNVSIAMNSEELFDYITNEELCYGKVNNLNVLKLFIR